MKKGMKALFSFNKVEIGQVFQALQAYRKGLKQTDKLLFDLVYIKLARQSSLVSFRSVVFDGMEMKLLAKALRYKGGLLFKKKNYLAAGKYFELLQVIEEDLYQFQKLNGPKI